MSNFTDTEFHDVLLDAARAGIEPNNPTHREHALRLIELAEFETPVVAPYTNLPYGYETLLSDMAGVLLGNYLKKYNPGLLNPFTDVMSVLREGKEPYVNFPKLYVHASKRHFPTLFIDVARKHGKDAAALQLQMMREAQVFGRMDFSYFPLRALRANQLHNAFALQGRVSDAFKTKKA